MADRTHKREAEVLTTLADALKPSVEVMADDLLSKGVEDTTEAEALELAYRLRRITLRTNTSGTPDSGGGEG